MYGKHNIFDLSNNMILPNNNIRLTQEIAINQERINNLRISSATDICMIIIFLAGLGIISYYVIFSLHIG